jgi:hypothetical protein
LASNGDDRGRTGNGFVYRHWLFLKLSGSGLGAVTTASSFWREQDFCSLLSKREKRPELQKICKFFAVPGFVSNKPAISSREGPRNPQQQEGEGGSRAERERVQIRELSD